MTPVDDGAFSVFWRDRRVGWIAARDIAAVAASVLRQGPLDTGARSKECWLSTEVASGYADAGADFTRQVIDGRMGYIGTVRDDVEFVTGRPSISLR